MDIWPDGYITANGIKIHYYRTGGDKPPLVINHGAGDDGLCWTRIAKELEADYDVVLPDARGHGRTSSGGGDYSTQTRVNDFAGLIHALDIENPVIGGHSRKSPHRSCFTPAIARRWPSYRRLPPRKQSKPITRLRSFTLQAPAMTSGAYASMDICQRC